MSDEEAIILGYCDKIHYKHYAHMSIEEYKKKLKELVWVKQLS